MNKQNHCTALSDKTSAAKRALPVRDNGNKNTRDDVAQPAGSVTYNYNMTNIPAFSSAKNRQIPQSGLPDTLRTGIETLSGVSMENVRVHYRSQKPAQIGAHAFAQGRDIHLGPGQERHLPHEAWHVVQQAQGRVRGGTGSMPTVNFDPGLESEASRMGQLAMRSNEATIASSQQVAASPIPDNVNSPASASPIQPMLRAAGTKLRLPFHLLRTTGRRGLMTRAEFADLPEEAKEQCENNPITPQFPALCHSAVDRHLLKQVPPKPQVEGFMAKFAAGIKGMFERFPIAETNSSEQAMAALEMGSEVGLRGTGLAGSNSVYPTGGHSVVLRRHLPGGDILASDPDHTHHPETQRLIEELAAKKMVQPHELTATDIEQIGGQRLFARRLTRERVENLNPEFIRLRDGDTRMNRFRFIPGSRPKGGASPGREAQYDARVKRMQRKLAERRKQKKGK
ncbi:MAG: DUF4157 domain-containing protein [Calditrichota bacterium]